MSSFGLRVVSSLARGVVLATGSLALYHDVLFRVEMSNLLRSKLATEETAAKTTVGQIQSKMIDKGVETLQHWRSFTFFERVALPPPVLTYRDLRSLRDADARTP